MTAFDRILVLPRSVPPWPAAGTSVISFEAPAHGMIPWSWQGWRTFALWCHDVGGGNPGAMTTEQANVAAKFIRVQADDPAVTTLVVSCFAGIGRSPSLAMAVADHFNLGRASIRWERRPQGVHDEPPNPHVYGLVRAALAEGER